MAMFSSKLLNYQRVSHKKPDSFRYFNTIGSSNVSGSSNHYPTSHESFHLMFLDNGMFTRIYPNFVRFC